VSSFVLADGRRAALIQNQDWKARAAFAAGGGAIFSMPSPSESHISCVMLDTKQTGARENIPRPPVARCTTI
jgi:hypothetical protein